MTPDPGTPAKLTQPRQARSRATMERILTALEELLTEKPFDQITIAEISTRSGSAPTAIYARFTDKTGLLLAAHERFRERSADAIVAAITDPEHTRLRPEEFLSYAAGKLIALFDANRQLLRSVLLSDNPQTYERATELARALSTAMAAQLSPSVPECQRADAERDLDFAVRAAIALVQQDLIFRGHTPTRFDYPATEFRDRVTRLLIGACSPYLTEAVRLPRK